MVGKTTTDVLNKSRGRVDALLRRHCFFAHNRAEAKPNAVKPRSGQRKRA
jgi:hypothetical protein